MSKIVEKKWYSGNLELDWGPNVPDQLRSATETYPRKCLVQNGKNHTIRMTLADLNNLITLQHLRKGRVRVFGRLAKQSHSHPGSNKRYYLETEQIQVEGDESSLSRDMSSGGGTERKFSLRSGDFTFIGVLVSFGPVLATPVEIPQRQTPQPQQDAPSTTMGTASRSVLLEVDILRAVDPPRSEQNSNQYERHRGRGRHYIMLKDEAAALLPYLVLHQLYTFTCAPPSPHYITSKHHGLFQPYLQSAPLTVGSISDPAAVCVHASEDAPPPPPHRPLISTDSIATLHRSILRPPSTLLKDTLMYTEMDIRGELLSTYTRLSQSQSQLQHSCSGDPATAAASQGSPWTWIELTGKAHPEASRGDKFLVFFALHPLLVPAGLPGLLLSLRRGAVVLVRNVFPVYLWGRLHGFAATSRSQFLIEKFSSLSISPRSPSDETTCAFARNMVVGVDVSCCGVSDSLTVSKEWKCVQFMAWWAYAQRRVVQALPIHWSSDSAGSLYTMSGFDATLSDTIFNIPVAMLDPRLLFPVSSITSPTITSAATTATATAAAAVDDAVLGGGAPPHWVLEATCDQEGAQLYLVRAGMDADFLCSRLPEVWTSSMLVQYGENMIIYCKRKMSKLEKKSISEIGSYVSSPSPRPHFNCLVSLAQASSLRHETFRCCHPILLVGAVTALLSPPLTHAGASSQEWEVGVGGVGAYSGLWCLSVTDRSGQALLVLIPLHPPPAPSCRCQQSHTPGTRPPACAANCFKTIFSLWEKLVDKTKLVVTLANPLVLAETHPKHNHQSAQLLVVVQGLDVWATWETPNGGPGVTVSGSGSDTTGTAATAPTAAASTIDTTHSRAERRAQDMDSTNSIHLKHSLGIGKFISSRLSKTSTTPDVHHDPSPELLYTSPLWNEVISVREALMVDPLIAPREVVVLPCVRGRVVWKEYTTDTGYYHVNDEALHSHSIHSSNGVKKRRLSLPKCVVHLRDTDFGDVLYLYLPATAAAAGVCVQHLVLNVFNCKLKLSGSKRHVFLDYDFNESHIGVTGVLALPDIQLAAKAVTAAANATVDCLFSSGGEVSRGTSTSSPNEVLIFNQQSNSHFQKIHSHVKVPKSNIYTLYQNHYRNRCMWSLTGRFILAKEINIFMRCNVCHTRASMTYASATTQNSFQCNGQGKCAQKASSSPSVFHVWWHGILVFDDGSGELQVCVEGAHLLHVLRALHEGNMQRSSRGRTHTQSTDTNKTNTTPEGGGKLSFISFQESVEKHVSTTFSLISYSFSSAAMARGYSALHDSDHGVCSEEVSTAAAGSTGSRRPGEGSTRCISKSDRSVQSVYNDYYDTSSVNGTQQRYFEKLRYVQLIQTLLQSCSFASSTFEMYVKIIFSNPSNDTKRSAASSSFSDGLSISLRRALGRLDSSSGSLTAGGRVQTHIRKVKVQCANVPSWMVENVELPSEAVATLRLQCVWVTRTPEAGAGVSGAGSGSGSGRGGAGCAASTAEQAWAYLNHS